MSANRLLCPHCGGKITLDQALHEGAVCDLLDRLTRFGPAARVIREYMLLFNLPDRGLPIERVNRLIGELLTWFEAGKYQYEGCTYRVERPQLIEALQSVLASKTLKPPLKDHAYLKAVLHPLAQKIAGRREREIEEGRRNRVPERATHASPLQNHEPPMDTSPAFVGARTSASSVEPHASPFEPPPPQETPPPEVQELLDQGKFADAAQLWGSIRGKKNA